MSKSTDKKSFILYKDSLNLLLDMTNEEAGKFIKAIYHYQTTNELPPLESGMKWAINPFINQFIRDDEDWIDKKIKASQAGKASANARQQKQQASTDVESVEQASTDSTVNVTVNASANVTVSDKENNKQDNATKVADDISELFNYWKETHQSPRSKLDDKRKKLIKSALGLYSVEDLKLAILGCSYSGFHMGKDPKTNGKQHNGIDLILRDADHIDSFIKMAEINKPVQPLQLMKIIYNDFIDKFVVYQYMPEAGGDLYCGESIPLDEIDNNPNIYKIIQDDRNK